MTLQELMSKTTDAFSVGRCFGAPIDKDGTMIIPVAIAGGGGGGGDAPADDGQLTTGGGFGGMAWPLGVYVVKGEDVRWVPAIDATRVALAALALVRIGLKLRAARRFRSRPGTPAPA